MHGTLLRCTFVFSGQYTEMYLAIFAQITSCDGTACLALFWLTNSHLKTVVSLTMPPATG
jgi:hypothetical protein